MLSGNEKHLSVYDYEKKMRKAEVAEPEQEISDQKDKTASQSFLMEVNEEALQSQEQILEENEAKAEKIRQETEYVGAFSGVCWGKDTRFYGEYRLWWQEQVVVVNIMESG